jgi:hypothetical protein
MLKLLLVEAREFWVACGAVLHRARGSLVSEEDLKR